MLNRQGYLSKLINRSCQKLIVEKEERYHQFVIQYLGIILYK